MMSPGSLLARLDQLKKWQEEQQERLVRQHNGRIREVKSRNVECMEGVSKLGDTDKKVLSPPKDFQVLLEETLKDDSAENGVNSSAKPKRPFLKKGSGLLRYGMKQGEQRKPYVKKTPRGVTINDNKRKPASDLKIPDVAIRPKVKRTDIDKEKLSEMPLDTPKCGSQVNSFNRRVIAQINKFTTENMKLEENAERECRDTYCDKELMIFETLEQKAMNSSFSSTNSSVVRLLSSTPQKLSPKKPVKSPIIEEIQETESHSCLIEKLLKDGNMELLLQKLQDYQTETPTASREESTSSSVNSDDIRECTEGTFQTPERPVSKQTNDVATCTDTCSETEDETTLGNVTEKEILTQKLEELEKEIERFRSENGKVTKLRRDLEIEQREFQKEKRKLIAELENERAELYAEIEEERKKLAKEKMVFEKYTKELRNKPTKQERTEISNLKIELANLKETQKLKDTKNSTTQARLRNQIKSLEKENANLKEEVEKLTKQNAKLFANQKIGCVRPSDTKMLNEINKNLNKLTKEAKVTERSQKINKHREVTTESSDESDVVEQERITQKKKAKSVSFVQPRLSEEKLKTPPENDNHLFYGSSSKENDKNMLNGNSFEGFDIEKHYEEVFGRNTELNGQRIPNTTVNESKKSIEDEIETILNDGSKEVKYSNGNVKITSPDGNIITTKYYNGDLKETNLKEGFIKYFYSETEAWQTTYADGTEILEFPNGQTEKKLKDGTLEIAFPDGVVRKIKADGSEEIAYSDGSVVTIETNGDRVLLLPNGQKEIHTREHKRREYPDGTVKMLYPDGTQETRYANGRIRIKDKDGKLLMDSCS